MANPHKEQRRREEANVGGMHEHRGEMDWTDRDERSDRHAGQHEGESDQRHHHHHHHHHGDAGDKSHRDYERLAEEAHSRTHGSQRRGGRTGHGDEADRDRRSGGLASQQGHDFGDEDRGRTDRHGTRGADDLGTSRSPRTGGDAGRRYGQRRQQRGRSGHDQGSPHEGSQRGSHREEGISGRMTGQRGTASEHTDPSDSTFREGEREHRHGGEHGTSERDRRFGSRRGHGSERETDHRTSGR